MRPHIISDVGYDCIMIRYNCNFSSFQRLHYCEMMSFCVRTRTFLLFRQLPLILSQYQVLWSRTLWYLIYWLTHVTQTQWPTVGVSLSLVTFWREREQCADSACCRDLSVWRTQISMVIPMQWFQFSINITTSRELGIGGQQCKNSWGASGERHYLNTIRVCVVKVVQ